MWVREGADGCASGTWGAHEEWSPWGITRDLGIWGQKVDLASALSPGPKDSEEMSDSHSLHVDRAS